MLNEDSPLPEISKLELEKRNYKDSAPAWVAVENSVFDVTGKLSSWYLYIGTDVVSKA